MNLNGFMTMLADAAPGAAPAATPASGSGAAGQQLPPWASLFPFLLIGIMIIVLWNSNTKRTKQQAALLKTIKPGDKVATSSGIMGTVVSVKEKSVAIRSADSKLEVLKSAVTEILERAGDSGSNES